MPRSVSSGFNTHINGDILTIAYCVKVTRRDGVVKGFTSLDTDLVFEGVSYEANAAVNATAVQSSLGSGIDNLDFEGMLTSSQITDIDIRAGVWDNASVDVFVINYSDLSQGKMTLLTGSFGEFEFADGTYRVEVRSLMQMMSQQVGDLYSQTCRVRRFLDSKCNPDRTLDPTNFMFTRDVVEVTSNYVIRFGSDTNGSAFYTYGIVEFRSGLNKGIEREIKKHVNLTSPNRAEITLHEPFPFAVAVGDTAVLTRGCDRRFISCTTLFSNGKNFQGEPYLPSNDQILVRGRR